LHDISDPKFNGGDKEAGNRLASVFLLEKGLDSERTGQIRDIIKHISYGGGISQKLTPSIEFQIVQDADRLDAMGAIGIARAFNYGGFKNRPIYDASVPVREYQDTASYYRSNAPTINHFYEKLLKLQGLLNTDTGKRLGAERHEYMVQFLAQFFREVHPGQIL
jgi:uncharacterized protein